MAEMCGHEAFGICAGCQLPKLQRASMRKGAYARLCPMFKERFREGAFVDQQISVLSKPDHCFTRGITPPVTMIESVSLLVNDVLLSSTDMLAVMPLAVARHYERLGVMTQRNLHRSGC